MRQANEVLGKKSGAKNNLKLRVIMEAILKR